MNMRIRTMSQRRGLKDRIHSLCLEHQARLETCREEVVLRFVKSGSTPDSSCSDAECVVISQVKTGN